MSMNCLKIKLISWKIISIKFIWAKNQKELNFWNWIKPSRLFNDLLSF